MENRCATFGCANLLQLLNVTSSVGVTAAVLGGDLIVGELNKTAIATLAERTTRYTMLVHPREGHNAEQVLDGLVKTMMTLPAHRRGSLTWDQGAKMAPHQQFAMATEMAVYFCDPHRPGSAEATRTPRGYCAGTSPRLV
jgi:transposase, IS30 family